MSLNQWPAPVPYDPEAEFVPAPLEALWSRPGESGSALVLAVGSRAEQGGWAARAAVAVATAWADRGGRIVLADLALDEPRLHIELGEANTDGVADIFQFGASVRRMARAVPGRGFLYLPAGAYVPDAPAILRGPGWDHIIGQLSEDRTTLLAYLPAEAEGGDVLIRRIGRAIVLAEPEEAPVLAAYLAGICRIDAVILPPPAQVDSPATEGFPDTGMSPASASDPEAVTVPEGASDSAAGRERQAEEPIVAVDPAGKALVSDAAAAADEAPPLTEPPPVPRRSRRSRRRTSVLLRLLLLVTVCVGGWALLDWQGVLPEWAAAPEWLRLPGAVPGVAAKAATGNGTPASSGAAAPGGGGAAAEPQAPPEPVSSPIPYSVAVEAHQDFSTAVERVQLLRRSEPGISFYLTPIPNQGVVYYRLLAGPAADTTGAWELMRRLVDSRHKTDLDPWSIRPTVWAYHIGDFPTAAAAEARAEELLQTRIPTYVVEVEYTSGPPRYRLFAGAYEGPAPAEVMAELLREAGIDAPLVRREGKPAR